MKMIPASEVVADLNDISDMVSGEIYETVIAVRDKYAPPPAIDWDAVRFGDEVICSDSFKGWFIRLAGEIVLVYAEKEIHEIPRADIKSITRSKYTKPVWHRWPIDGLRPAWLNDNDFIVVKDTQCEMPTHGQLVSQTTWYCKAPTHFAVIKGGE